MKTVTHYDRLGVSRNAPEEVIRAAYKALAQKNHPDKNLNNPGATELMQLINQAYDVLSNPKKREDYDAWLAQQETVPVTRPPQSPPAYQQQAQAAYPGAVTPGVGKKLELAFFIVAMLGAIGFIFFNSFNNYRFPGRGERPAGTTQRLAATVAAKPKEGPESVTPRQLALCIFSAAQTYSVPPPVLLSLLSAEEGSVGMRLRRADNTYDMGLMKINSSWLPQLARLWVVSHDTAQQMLQDDACVNVGVAAWLLHSAMSNGGGLPDQIGIYFATAHHLSAKTEDEAYVGKVMKMMDLYKSVRSPDDLLDQVPAVVGK